MNTVEHKSYVKMSIGYHFLNNDIRGANRLTSSVMFP